MNDEPDQYEPYRPLWLRDPIDSNVPRLVYGMFAGINASLVVLATQVRVDTRPRVWTHTWDNVPDAIVPYFVSGSLLVLIGLCWWSNRIAYQTCQKPAWIINCWTIATVSATMLFFLFISES